VPLFSEPEAFPLNIKPRSGFHEEVIRTEWEKAREIAFEST
jgi:hypothetical protein